MIEKRNFFNFTTVSETEYNDFLKEEYNDNKKYKTEQAIYLVLLILFIIYGLISLVYHFVLTFIGGVAAYINVIIAILPQICKIPCFLNVFSANILNVFINIV
ncbi:hypothetical protein PIROE2DRAFT_9319 [Piromyces sp. E2]|nr:hypothetical protein PIROE2DRAFT_9319 [Piromyces sp. E2]|eukprot:OUM64017.1 hypothetical protein PIROE2DRAFT_9319 [Piromyces sp. E2]